MRRAEVV